jgi:hypothetical protein
MRGAGRSETRQNFATGIDLKPFRPRSIPPNTPHPSRRSAPIHLLPQGGEGRVSHIPRNLRIGVILTPLRTFPVRMCNAPAANLTSTVTHCDYSSGCPWSAVAPSRNDGKCGEEIIRIETSLDCVDAGSFGLGERSGQRSSASSSTRTVAESSRAGRNSRSASAFSPNSRRSITARKRAFDDEGRTACAGQRRCATGTA